MSQEKNFLFIYYISNFGTEIRSPFDLLRIARFPRPGARQLARPAEIYERAIQLIHEELNKGMNFTLPGE